MYLALAGPCDPCHPPDPPRPPTRTAGPPPRPRLSSAGCASGVTPFARYITERHAGDAAGGVVLRRAAEHHDWLAVVARRHELHDAPNLPPRPLSFIYMSGARCTKSAAAAACGGPKTTGCFRPRQLNLLFIFREFSLRKQG